MTQDHVPQRLSAQLKQATDTLHSLAERHPIQRALVSGQLGSAEYAALLAQLWLVHDALERAVQRVIASDSPAGSALGTVWQPQLAHADQVLEDLTYFQGSKAPATPATAALTGHIDDLEQSAPLGLLGLIYVLEGSLNGGRYIAIALRKAHGLTGTQGTRSLDPYLDEQPANWQRWKDRLDSLALDTADRDLIIECAQTMFQAITAIFDDLHEPMPA